MLQPRCLRDTTSIDSTVEVFRRRWPWPFALAPTGLNGLVRPERDVLIARTAARIGLPFVQSTAPVMLIDLETGMGVVGRLYVFTIDPCLSH